MISKLTDIVLMWRGSGRKRRTAARLDDRTLRDIGLTRLGGDTCLSHRPRTMAAAAAASASPQFAASSWQTCPSSGCVSTAPSATVLRLCAPQNPDRDHQRHDGSERRGDRQGHGGPPPYPKPA
jgi:hypothetical protein